MGPYRENALVRRKPSSWERFTASLKETWTNFMEQWCRDRRGHSWIVSRYWDFRRDWPEVYVQIPHELGQDATCQKCGRQLLTFSRTREVLQRMRFIKANAPFDLDRHAGIVLRREIEPLLREVCLPKDSSTYPRREYDGRPEVQEYDPKNPFLMLDLDQADCDQEFEVDL